MRVLRGIALLALLSGCEFTRDPVAIEGTETQFGVFGLLIAGADSASLLVVQSQPAPPPGHLGWEGVGGATLRLVAGSDTIPLIEQQAGSRPCALGVVGDRPTGALGCYRAAIPGGIIAGATYGLVADIPGFGRILGRTTIPMPPVIEAPAAGTRLPVDALGNTFPPVYPSVVLRGQAGPGTERLEARLLVRDSTRTCEAYFLAAAFTIQGLLVLDPDEASDTRVRYQARCYTQAGPQPVGELAAAIRMTAYEANYARFAEDALDDVSQALLSRYARSGIDRGVGYFGGAAFAEQPVVLMGGGS